MADHPIRIPLVPLTGAAVRQVPPAVAVSPSDDVPTVRELLKTDGVAKHVWASNDGVTVRCRNCDAVYGMAAYTGECPAVS